MQDATRQAYLPHHYLYLPLFFFPAPFFSSKMLSSLPFPVLNSIPKFPLCSVQSWAMFSMHPMMCHPPRQQLPYSEKYWGELPVTHGDGGHGLHAHTLELRLCCDSPRQVVCNLCASLIWVPFWASADGPSMVWWLLWWAWEQAGRVLFWLLSCHWFSELLCRYVESHFFSEPDTSSVFSSPQ